MHANGLPQRTSLDEWVRFIPPRSARLAKAVAQQHIRTSTCSWPAVKGVAG